MKKLIALLLVAGIVAVSVGCSGSPTTKSTVGGGGTPTHSTGTGK